MAGLGIVIPRQGPGTGPVIPVPLHSVGVAGASHRYVPERSGPTQLGAAVTALPDLIGSASLTVAGSGTVNPVIADSGGQRYMTIPTELRYLQATGADFGGTFTSAYVVKHTGSGEFASADGYAMRRNSDGSWGLLGNGGQVQLAPGSSAWVVYFGICSSASSRLAVDGAVTPTAGLITGPVSTSADRIRLGGGSSFGAGTEMAVAENVVWPFALSEAQRAAFVAAMRAKWTALLA
jgi:hypothetical protein